MTGYRDGAEACGIMPDGTECYGELFCAETDACRVGTVFDVSSSVVTFSPEDAVGALHTVKDEVNIYCRIIDAAMVNWSVRRSINNGYNG